MGAVMGAASAIGFTGSALIEWTLAAAEGLDVATIVEFDAAIGALSVTMVVVPLIFAGPIGLALLAVGVWRSRAVPRWVPVVLGLAILLLVGAVNDVMAMASNALLLVSFLGIAWFYGIRQRPARDDAEAVTPKEAPPSHTHGG
jgi:hypothetical protein